MRLHRLRVADFRGIVEREVMFADSGVTVIEGENEAGKSSMVEALDLLLTTRANSSKSQVRAVQPSGRDVGSEVFAEISCGAYRFEYFKRFNKSPETALTIVEPAPEQLTGRPAHERVEQILGASLDNTLYRALRLLQSSDPELGDLTDSSALSRALDRAAGEVDDEGADTPESQDLVAAVAKEYSRYFTAAQGRPSGELLQARNVAEKAAAAVAERERLLESVQEAADRLPDVTRGIEDAMNEESQQRIEVSTLAAQVSQADAVGERLATAKAVVARYEAGVQAARSAVRERTDLRNRLGQSESEIATTSTAVQTAREAAAVAGEQATVMAERVVVAQRDLDDVRTRIESAEAAERVAADRRRLTEMDVAIAEVERLSGEVKAARRAAEGVRATPEDAARAVELDREIAAATARLESGSATVVVTPLADGVRIGGVAADDEQTLTVTAATTIEAPSVRVEVTPGADMQALADDLARLTSLGEEVVARCGVENLADVAGAAAKRTESLRVAAEAERRLQRELSGRAADGLTTARAQLATRIPAGDPPSGSGDDDLVALRTSERELSEAVGQAQRERDAQVHREQGERNRAQAWETSGENARLAATALRQQIAAAEQEASDDELAAAVTSADDQLTQAKSAEAKTAAEAARVDAAGVRAKYDEAEAALDRTRARLAQQRKLQAELSTRIEVCRNDGRLDELSDAVAENEAAQAALVRVSERAEGARVLHETLQRKRSDSRARYIDPFARRLEELAAPVFGDGVRFSVGDDFRIASRTLDGVTVDVTALSGGAREQLGLLARLACASLVDEADGVPVILDDALGYTDPKRLASMSTVIGSAGPSSQIIVLTCTPDRYRGVDDATLIAV
ncbi:AAA family ATPase [Gordonia sp. HY002]|uniref:AAA family ATPase n=1 Tax=Gordonia zhenghanii TaxID=2911516 RepID=UPI001EEFC037|nr:AAA family ATPase [Gordonia zhenghanii]MCF8570612.1 AAA family ATPase [Gordonia zhenghanii]MCF8605061.1 AAA family ATPase [Gordonia zhenghanii]